MAAHTRNGSRRARKVSPEAESSGTPQRASKYTLVLESAANLNRALDQTLDEMDRLKTLGFFWGDAQRFFKTGQLFIEELRNWAMADVTQELLDHAEYEYGQWGVRRFRWEERFRDPEDVLKQAERVKKKLAEQTAKKKAKRSKRSRQ